MTNSGLYLVCSLHLPVTPVDCVNVGNKDMTMNEEEMQKTVRYFHSYL